MGTSPQLVLGTALGPLTVLWLRKGCGPGAQLRDSLGDSPLPRGGRGYRVCRGAGLGDTPGDPPDTHHCRGYRVEKSLWTSCLRRGAGGQSYRSPHPEQGCSVTEV